MTIEIADTLEEHNNNLAAASELVADKAAALAAAQFKLRNARHETQKRLAEFQAEFPKQTQRDLVAAQKNMDDANKRRNYQPTRPDYQSHYDRFKGSQRGGSVEFGYRNQRKGAQVKLPSEK